MRFKATPVTRKKPGEGNPNWVSSRFELSSEEAQTFHAMRDEADLNINQLVKQMVLFCIRNSKEEQ